jgi:hypothetical protein
LITVAPSLTFKRSLVRLISPIEAVAKLFTAPPFWIADAFRLISLAFTLIFPPFPAV